MLNRTDLADESFEKEGQTYLQGVKVSNVGNQTIVDVLNEVGANKLGKPVGKYITLKVKSFVNDTDIFDGRLNEFSKVLKSLLPQKCNSVLVVGLGNLKITADALGPEALSFVLATRHIMNDVKENIGIDDLFSVSTISTGVLGNTGIETLEIIKGVVNQTNPSCVIVIDALASSSMKRLGATIQFSNAGIVPGSGVGNHRDEISFSTLGVPVVTVGIPTVVCTSVISGNKDDVAFVTPREIDRIIQQGAKLIGMGINVTFQNSISAKELFALVG